MTIVERKSSNGRIQNSVDRRHNRRMEHIVNQLPKKHPVTASTQIRFYIHRIDLLRL